VSVEGESDGRCMVDCVDNRVGVKGEANRKDRGGETA